MSLDLLLLLPVCFAFILLLGMALVYFLLAYDRRRDLRCREQILRDYRRQCADAAQDLNANANATANINAPAAGERA